MAIKARKPVRADYKDMLAVGRSMHAESYYRDFDYSRRKFDHLFENAIRNPMYFGRVFVERDDRPVGFFLGTITEHYFGYDRLAMDLGLYVGPDHRGSAGLAVVKVLRRFEEWAAGNGCRDVVLGVSAGITDKKSIELYKRLGYSKPSMMLHKKVH